MCTGLVLEFAQWIVFKSQKNIAKPFCSFSTHKDWASQGSIAHCVVVNDDSLAQLKAGLWPSLRWGLFALLSCKPPLTLKLRINSFHKEFADLSKKFPAREGKKRKDLKTNKLILRGHNSDSLGRKSPTTIMNNFSEEFPSSAGEIFQCLYVIWQISADSFQPSSRPLQTSRTWHSEALWHVFKEKQKYPAWRAVISHLHGSGQIYLSWVMRVFYACDTSQLRVSSTRLSATW